MAVFGSKNLGINTDDTLEKAELRQRVFVSAARLGNIAKQFSFNLTSRVERPPAEDFRFTPSGFVSSCIGVIDYSSEVLPLFREGFIEFEEWREKVEDLAAAYSAFVFFHPGELPTPKLVLVLGGLWWQSGLLFPLAENVERECPRKAEIFVGATIQCCRIIQRRLTFLACNNLGDPSIQSLLKAVLDEVIEPVQSELLKFDFRNGSLRRKYDSVKYIVKNLEELQYQLSFAQSGVTPSCANGETNTNDDCEFTVERLFQRARETLMACDLVRDDIIKKTRDITKAGKQAIYACHRGNLGEAKKQIALGHKLAGQIIQRNLTEPTESIGNGSQSEAARNGGQNDATQNNAQNDTAPLSGYFPSLRANLAPGLEEIGEACLLYDWISGVNSNEAVIPHGDTIQRPPLLNDTELIGSLSDFTGELHRWSVTKATARDLDSVKRSVALQTQICQLLLSLHGNVGKKAIAALQNRSKTEQLLLEVQLGEVMHVSKKLKLDDNKEEEES